MGDKHLILDVNSKRRKQKYQQFSNQKIKWWRLKGDKHLNFNKKSLKKGNLELHVNVNLIWEDMSKSSQRRIKMFQTNR